MALSETFSVTPTEGCEQKETGWRMRKKIIDERIPCHVYRAFTYPNHPDPKVTYFGTTEDPVGVHLLKGSSLRTADTPVSYRTSLEVAQGHVKWPLPLQ